MGYVVALCSDDGPGTEVGEGTTIIVIKTQSYLIKLCVDYFCTRKTDF